MPDQSANVSCSVEMYPFEGGPYTIQGGQIKSVIVSKSIRNGSPGTFAIELAPGGPLGPEDPNTWSQIATPMSHVVIGMARGSSQYIVLDGIVSDAGEVQQWTTAPQGSFAARGQAISGGDFSWFFNTFSFYALTFHGLVAGTPVGNALDFLPGSLANIISQGLIGGASSAESAPVQVGRLWFQQVMGGKNGILGNTSLPYKPPGTRVPFWKAVAATWENYPDVYIPYAENFMVVEETWMAKMRSIFGSPWYEFFVTTSPANAYGLPRGSKGIQDPGTQFSMTSMPAAVAAGPKLVARVNPFPRFGVVPSGTQGAVSPGTMDVSRWNALPIYDFSQSGFGFIRSNVTFSSEEACNFYQLNPTSFLGLFGMNNANNIPGLFSFVAAVDPASVQRYGFRPSIATTRWLFDPNGAAAQNANLNVQNTVLQLTANYVSWMHPAPLMARGSVTIPLNPAVLVGARFRYAPFKNGELWDFYIEGFRHDFVFGGPSTTTLELTRGLPTLIYADTSDSGILRAICTGNAMRKNGRYVVGLPPSSAPPLSFVLTVEQAADVNQLLAKVFVTPQPAPQ